MAAHALEVATAASTGVWQRDLKVLFDNAKERFADVVWDFVSEDGTDRDDDEVWGHKAMVYARAPPSFQARYFSFRPAPVASPNPYSSGSPIPQSTLSLDRVSPSRSPSPFNAPRSSSPMSLGPLLRLSTTANAALFSNQLEYLYTAKSFGDAFEFLFDQSAADDKIMQQSDAEHARIDKLRKDFVYMWRSRLYSDVRLSLTGTFSATPANSDASTAIFSSHKFILVSRSQYFRNLLLSGFAVPPSPASGVLTLTLPSPPFTPASLHFTLGFLYTGTLVFSHRTYDLDTAFAIMRSATYLTLDTLYKEVEARIVEEMMHGLCAAYLPFADYEKQTGGKWGAVGCKCKQCMRRAPRVLQFAMADDVKNGTLEGGSRRALVSMFGEGWVTQEFASLPAKTRSSLLQGLQKRTTPLNIFPLLSAAQAAFNKLDGIQDIWTHPIRDMVTSARKKIDEVLCARAEECFEQEEWVSMMGDGDGVRFDGDDTAKVEAVMASLLRGLTEKNAGTVYQTLVSAILLRPHPKDHGDTLLSSTSPIRKVVEKTRVDMIQWLRKHWVGVQQNSGFNGLEGWALKEISDELEIPSDDLLAPQQNGLPRGPPTRTGLRPVLSRADPDAETASLTSLRASVLNRNLAKANTTPSISNGGSSSNGSGSATATERDRDAFFSAVQSARSSTAGRAGNGPLSPPAVVIAPPASRKTSVASSLRSNISNAAGGAGLGLALHTPALSSSSLVTDETHNTQMTSNPPRQPVSTVAARRNVSTVGPSAGDDRPRSLAASVDSVKSHASTIRRRDAQAAALSLGAGTSSRASLAPPGASRPTSSVSMRSDASSAFKTARSEASAASAAPAQPKGTRSRTTSMASTVSQASVRDKSPAAQSTRGQTLSPPSTSTAKENGQRTVRARKSSTTSVASMASSVVVGGPSGASASTSKGTVRRVPPNGDARKSQARPDSVASTRSVTTKRSATSVHKSPAVPVPPLPPDLPPKVPAKDSPKATPPVLLLADENAKKNDEDVQMEDAMVSPTSTIRNRQSVADPDRTVGEGDKTVRGIKALKRKTSSDTITESNAATVRASGPPRPPSAATTITSPPRSPEPAPAAPPSQPLVPITVTAGMPAQKARGITLNIGIPCIITSKRSRFRAFARYIGELEGEFGPWIGVEVPVGGSWSGDKLEGRDWNDGSWAGVRYFDVGNGSEWDDNEERTQRQRRLEWVSSAMTGSMSPSLTASGKTLKREGEQLGIERAKRLRSVSPAMSDASGSESRGLFVRPQQVLYVVDAEQD